MTIRRRPSEERGHFDHGWLDAKHTFSFAGYTDPEHDGFRSLQVLNEDRIAPAKGFDAHPHRDMEILTYVLDGALAHQDNLGEPYVVGAGELHYLGAGDGIVHSELNASKTEWARILQIWIVPERAGLEPRRDRLTVDPAALRGRLALVASQTGREGSLAVRQDVELRIGWLGRGESLRHPLAPGRHAWVQVGRGAVDLGDVRLVAGDGAAVSEEAELAIRARVESEVLVVDLA